MLIGYARVSTADQNTSIQYEAFLRAGVSYVVEEKRSAVKKRPVLEDVLQRIGPGDTLVVYKMDRLARSLVHLLSVFAHLEARSAGFRSLTEPIETETPVGRLFMQMLGSFAEFERALIRDRCLAGQIAARARGQVWGRPRVLGSEDEAGVVEMYRSGFYTVPQIAQMLGVGLGAVRGPLCRAGLLSTRYLR
ncbi:DNA invertase Pin-like site-specific DNA recombinase [Variovorax sp. 54]|uniref:recombinase family protein n=1 Tax=Variovorax sp. 54 TaxID=2035212 RepID=UPI000C60D09E|nr:recombinase family protein [Variovorax sp. 54]PIF76911.1 DNA invertase Pin-like site-specific DNA recombinase [Variovorax sp. 54]